MSVLAHAKAGGATLARYAYALDKIGNRASVDRVQPLAASPPTVLTTTYQFDEADQLLRAGTTTFTYDAIGNTRTRTDAAGQTTFTYDAFGRLVQLQDSTGASTYTYDGDGTRVARTRGGIETRFVVDTAAPLSQVLMEETGNETTYCVYGRGLIARIGAAGERLQYHFDGTGSTVVMTDAAGTVVNAYVYDEFGGNVISQEAKPQRFKFGGQAGLYTEDEKLIFVRARYLDPTTGRFVTRDPLHRLLAPEHPFVYAANNPISLQDVNGLWVRSAMEKTKGAAQSVGKVLGKSVREGGNFALCIGSLTLSDGSCRAAGLSKTDIEIARVGAAMVVPGGGYTLLATVGAGEFAGTFIKMGIGELTISDALESLADAGFSLAGLKAEEVVGQLVKQGYLRPDWKRVPELIDALSTLIKQDAGMLDESEESDIALGFPKHTNKKAAGKK